MEAKRPNVVLILADDMGYSDIGCFGSEIETPVLDQMAREGMRFTGMLNNARCCPSRASLLTGLYPHQAGIGLMVGNMGIPPYQGYLNERCVTIAEALRASGYRTAMSGKWHVGGGYGRDPKALERAGQEGYPTPNSRGFHHFYGILEGAGSYFNPATLRENEQNLSVAPGEEFYLTDRISDKAAEMIGEMKDEPFFLYVAYNAPHWPLHAPADLIEKYRGRYREGWEAVRARRFEKQRAMGLLDEGWPLSPKDEEAPDWDAAPDHEWEDMRMAVYAAQVERMDAGIGRVMQALRENGVEENTLVIFLSDNGGCAEPLEADMDWLYQYVSPMRDGTPVQPGNDRARMPGGEDTYMSYGLPWANVSNTPFRLFKHWIHEGGIATPMVAHWPAGIRNPGAMRRESLHFIDIMPTLLSLCGAQYPQVYRGHEIQPAEGVDFSALFADMEWQREKPIFWEHEGNAGMLQGEWKLVRRYPGDWELYHLPSDRTEQHNRAAEQSERLQNMIAAYQAWAARVGVVLPEELARR